MMILVEIANWWLQRFSLSFPLTAAGKFSGQYHFWRFYVERISFHTELRMKNFMTCSVSDLQSWKTTLNWKGKQSFKLFLTLMIY